MVGNDAGRWKSDCRGSLNARLRRCCNRLYPGLSVREWHDYVGRVLESKCWQGEVGLNQGKV